MLLFLLEIDKALCYLATLAQANLRRKRLKTALKANSMKAEEVLERYREGERDFRRVNLRGQSFKGKDLSGADFSQADIRGVNFTNANLSGANFHGAKAGLQKRWAIGLVLASCLITGISASFPVVPSYFVSLALDISHLQRFSVGITSLVVLTVLFIVTIRRGLAAGLIVVAIAVAVAFTYASVESFAEGFADGFAGARTIAGVRAAAAAAAAAAVRARAGAVALAWAQAFTLVVAFAGATAVTIAVAVAVARIAAGAVTFTVAFTVALVFALVFALSFALTNALSFTVAAFTVAGAVAVAMLGVYVGWCCLAGDEKHDWVRSFAIAFTATGGTSFRDADLTDVDFTSATLKSTNFRGAIVTRTCWAQAKKLGYVRPGKTYLRNVQLRQWLIGNGRNNNFDRQDLRGVNLKGANLADASFIGADLSQANLQDADLSRAKLVQTQLDETDLTGATLTGACIEDWGITSHTKLDGVRCEYVFMRLETKENPNRRRKPDNWEETFKDGDFADFIKPITDTLDLYHNRDVDPRAIAISFKQLAENNPKAELQIVAMEKRSEDKFLLRAETAALADKSELSREYFDTYNQVKALSPDAINVLIAEKERQIGWFANVVETVMKRPSLQAENYYNQGDTMSEHSGNSSYNLNHAKFGGGFTGTGGTQTGGTFHEDSSDQNRQSQPQTLVSNHIVCTQCGRQNPNTFNFCIKCGSKLALPT